MQRLLSSEPAFFPYRDGMCAEIEQDYPGERLYGESLATGLIAHLLTRYGAPNASSDRCKGAIGLGRLRAIIAYIDHNLAADLLVAEMAAPLRLSPPRFARLSKQAIGLSPHQFVLRKHIVGARAILETSAMPLAEISSSLARIRAISTQYFIASRVPRPRFYRDRRRA